MTHHLKGGLETVAKANKEMEERDKQEGEAEKVDVEENNSEAKWKKTRTTRRASTRSGLSQ